MLQVWPLEFCRRVAHAIATLRSELRPEKLKSAFPSKDDTQSGLQIGPNGDQTCSTTFRLQTGSPQTNAWNLTKKVHRRRKRSTAVGTTNSGERPASRRNYYLLLLLTTCYILFTTYYFVDQYSVIQ